jgi:hypothetical protein
MRSLPCCAGASATGLSATGVSLAVMQSDTAVSEKFLKMVPAIAREQHGRFRYQLHAPRTSGRGVNGGPGARLRERSGPFAFRCRNQPTRRSLADGSQTPPISDAGTAPPSTIRGLALPMPSSSARPDRGMRPPDKITLRRDASKAFAASWFHHSELTVFSCAAAPASPSVKPIRRNDVEAMGPALKCRRMSSMVELVVAIVAFVSACIFLAHAIEAYRA